MATTLDPRAAEAKARELLDARIASVRTLVTARQHLTDLRDQLTHAERQDITAYNAALRDGWSPEELRAVGITEPDKKTRTRRRAARKTTPPTDHDPAADSGPPDETPA